MSKKILYISSANPTKGPGAIALDHFKALLQAGYTVDFLTKLPVEGHPEIKYVQKKPYHPRFDQLRRFPFYFLKKFKKPIGENSYCYFYRKENEPPVPVRKVLRKLDNDYDMIIVFFWQELLTYKTINDIFDKQINHPKVYFINADYSTMTGGCHFFDQCNNYETGCGNCPMINSKNPNDFTAWNVRYRQIVVNKIKPIISVNSQTQNNFERSSVFKNYGVKFIKGTMILDLEKFKPIAQESLIQKYGIKPSTKFIILFGAQNINDPRKGMEYLFDSLNQFYKKLNTKEREEVLLISIGKEQGLKDKLPPFQHKHLGYVPVDQLPELYSLANVYLSPSVNDPGPSMVNQAIACGTPVVAFEMGTALDVIKDKGSGICVPLKDTELFSQAIKEIYHLSPKDYNKMKLTARKVAEEFHSYKCFSDKIAKILNN